MARKFFNQKVKGSSNRSMVAWVVVGVCVVLILLCVILVFVFSNNNTMPADARVEIRDVVTVEINSELPDKTLFFAELENVSEDNIEVAFGNADLTTVGEYTVDISVYDQNYEATIAVVDTQAPTLVTKNYAISAGSTYQASDFVDSCTDNSNQSCDVVFYTLAMDQNGALIDYSNYTEEGIYTVQIIARDATGNTTTPMNATLTIGDASDVQPTYCTYGNSVYDTNSYILGVNVTQNGCALDLNLYYNSEVTAPAYNLSNSTIETIKKQFEKLNINNVAEININAEVSTVLNTAGTGIVGYTVHHDVTIVYEDGTEELAASYYINTSGERIYSVNKYNLD